MLFIFQIKIFPDKGRGIAATKFFEQGEFVVEYAGDLLDIPTALAIEAEYYKDPEIGSYMFFFKVGRSDKQFWLVFVMLFFSTITSF